MPSCVWGTAMPPALLRLAYMFFLTSGHTFTKGVIPITSPYVHNEIPEVEIEGNAALELAIEQAEKENCVSHHHDHDQSMTTGSSPATPYFDAQKGEAGGGSEQKGNGDFLERALSRRKENGMDNR